LTNAGPFFIGVELEAQDGEIYSVFTLTVGEKDDKDGLRASPDATALNTPTSSASRSLSIVNHSFRTLVAENFETSPKSPAELAGDEFRRRAGYPSKLSSLEALTASDPLDHPSRNIVPPQAVQTPVFDDVDEGPCSQPWY